jgi:subtilisin family serine protease
MEISHPLDTIGPSIDIGKELGIGIWWAAFKNADVINNSWSDDDSGYQEMHDLLLEEKIDSAIDYGRGGKGCVVVFGTGNPPGGWAVDYPANYRSEILAVAAIDSLGHRYGDYGDELDIVAPGYGLLTTDSLLTQYTKVAGTSYATAYVSGIAGLMLSVNSNLTGKEVRDIIESTAQKLDSYTYETTESRPNGTWNNETGYGLVDAYCAVYHAQTVELANIISGIYERYIINIRNATIQNGSNLTLTGAEVTVNGAFEVENGAEFEINSKNSFTCD